MELYIIDLFIVYIEQIIALAVESESEYSIIVVIVFINKVCKGKTHLRSDFVSSIDILKFESKIL